MGAPKIPDHTCPLIDTVISVINRSFKVADEAYGNEDLIYLQEAIREIRYILRGECDTLETIRAANLALRNAAEYWQGESERLDAELNNALAEIE